jgi:hypothetical protein
MDDPPQACMDCGVQRWALRHDRLLDSGCGRRIWHAGQPRKATALAAAAEQALLQPCDTDDRAMATARLAQVREVLGDKAAEQRLRAESQTLYATHCEQQQRLAALLDAALAGVDPISA